MCVKRQTKGTCSCFHFINRASDGFHTSAPWFGLYHINSHDPTGIGHDAFTVNQWNLPTKMLKNHIPLLKISLFQYSCMVRMHHKHLILTNRKFNLSFAISRNIASYIPRTHSYCKLANSTRKHS